MGLVGNEKFVFSAPNPYSGSRARLCIDVLYDRTHLVCGHQFSNCYPLTCTRLALQQCPDEAAPTDLTRLRETGSTLDIWLVPYKWLGVSVSLTLATRRRLQRRAPTGM